MKKFIALMLASLMVIGMLAGCSHQESPKSNDSVDQNTPTDKNTSPDADAEVQEDPVEIVWFIRNDEPQHYDEVMAAVNEKLLAEKNMTLDLRFISPGDYETKMQMAMAGGDDWDLCFTSHWSNSYVNAAGKGAYLELTPEMLAENAPNVMKVMPEQFWDGVKVNGGIYGLINYQIMYSQAAFMFLKEVVDELKIDVTTIDNWDALNEALGQIAEAYPDRYATRGGGPTQPELLLQETPLSLVMGLPFLMFDTKTQKIDNNKFFEEIEPTLASFKLWKDEGYVPADAATLKDENTLLKSGQIITRYQANKPGVEASLKLTLGLDYVVVPMGGSVVSTNSVQSTITAVNINSKHPEKAVQLYDYIFSNPEIANMLFYGLEGLDYEMVDGYVQTKEDCWKAPQWQLGNQFNAYLTVGSVDGVWEETMKLNAEADLDPLFGFVPDRSAIETELASCEAVWGEYKDILYYGLQDYTTVIPEMMAKLEVAGLKTVTEELQSQIDAYLASK